jgi:hypothetical protein
MRDRLDIDLIFPVRDTASAELMRLKADCLYAARIIDAPERRLVHERIAVAYGESAGCARNRAPAKAVPGGDARRNAA